MKNLLKSKGLPRPRRKVDIGIVALLILGGYFLVYKPVVTWQDKQRFKEAEKAIEQLYTEIESKVGRPDQTKRDKSCGYASRKYERGPLGCGITINFVFSVTGKTNATALFSKINNVVDTRTDLLQLISEDVSRQVFHREVEQPRDAQEINLSYKSYRSNLNCFLGYDFSVSTDRSLVISFEESEKNLVVEMGCGGPAKAEHYPIKN